MLSPSTISIEGGLTTKTMILHNKVINSLKTKRTQDQERVNLNVLIVKNSFSGFTE